MILHNLFVLLSSCFLVNLVFMLCVFCLTFFLYFFYIKIKIKIEKSEKYKNNVCLCILVLVYLGWPLKQSLNFVSLVVLMNISMHKLSK